MKSGVNWHLYAKSLADFVLAECKGMSLCGGLELVQVAGQVLLIRGDELVTVREVFNELSSRRFIQNSQIFEAWEYQVAHRVINYAKQLAPTEKRALQVFSGYTESSLEPLGKKSYEAIIEAHAALYGERA